VRSPLRPIPSLGGRRRRGPPVGRLLLAVPRVSPERELATLRALMKPQEKRALLDRIDDGEQPWPADGPARVLAAAAAARGRLGFAAEVHLPAAGEYRAVAGFDAAALPAALAAALLLSHRLPGAWVVVGRLYARDGQFYRRERGVKLTLRPAADVHLSRDLRAAVRALVRDGDDVGASDAAQPASGASQAVGDATPGPEPAG
jgi:hypothetical protein